MPTAPPILIWSGDHLGLDRILVDVSKQGDKVAGIADRLAAEAVMEQRPKAFMPLVIVADIGNANAFHHHTDVLSALSNEQMNVVVHQAVGMNVTVGRYGLSVLVLRSCDGFKDFEEFAPVLIVGKDIAAIDASHHHVIDSGVTILTACSWHRQWMISLAKILNFLEMGDI